MQACGVLMLDSVLQDISDANAMGPVNASGSREEMELESRVC